MKKQCTITYINVPSSKLLNQQSVEFFFHVWIFFPMGSQNQLCTLIGHFQGAQNFPKGVRVRKSLFLRVLAKPDIFRKKASQDPQK